MQTVCPLGGSDNRRGLWMWAVMMAAMMLPSAVPMVAALSKVAQARRSASNPAVAFVAGYLVVWAAFSAIATAAQWALQSAGMLSPMGSSMSRVLTGIRCWPLGCISSRH